jgi:hypothetical protein
MHVLIDTKYPAQNAGRVFPFPPLLLPVEAITRTTEAGNCFETCAMWGLLWAA